MTKRINFDVDDETKLRIDDVMAAAGISSQKRLFEDALEIFSRVRRLVQEHGRVVLAIQPSRLDAVLRAASEGVVIVEEPPYMAPRWLVMRTGDWHATPWLKGTRVHVGDIRALLRAEPEMTSSELAFDLNVPLEAVQEAITYIEANTALLDAEEREAAMRAKEIETYAPASR